MKGCPLKVTVSSTVDASKVICSGEGLKWGILGREIKSFIDTRSSGPGKNYLHFQAIVQYISISYRLILIYFFMLFLK